MLYLHTGRRVKDYIDDEDSVKSDHSKKALPLENIKFDVQQQAEPKKKMSSKKIYKQIEKDPNHETIGILEGISYSVMKIILLAAIALPSIMTVLFTLYFIDQDDELMGAISLIVGFLGTCVIVIPFAYLIDAYFYDRVIFNEFGIGEELRYPTLNGFPTGVMGYRAFEWRNIERIDLKIKNGKIIYFMMQSRNRKVESSRRLGCKDLKIDYLQEYIPRFAEWKSKPKKGEKDVLTYLNPEISEV